MKILTPKNNTYIPIAKEFISLCQKTTGQIPEMTSDSKTSDDLIVIGSGYEKDFPFILPINEKLTPDSDDYIVCSGLDNGRQILYIAGARLRSLWYAVYDYFETYMGCRYFWDGDIIPKSDSLVSEGVYIEKKFRFRYRGQRYFAHRGLQRFQAEMWDIEDWQKEIDWMLKKKLNMFMLRIGQDDLFQRAFPDIVSYPDDNTHWDKDKPDYFDRTTAWPLRYRGELRKKILDYAFDRDLIHCEDCGTMTHWYSQTPQEFLDKVKPKFSTDHDDKLKSNMAWDTSVPENMANYWHLTDTHIKEFGKAELFHTIGQAERINSTDHDENIEAKIKVFEETEKYIEEHYPDAKLLIASWDFWISFKNEDVPKLLKRLNPERSIIFDYTSDAIRYKNFTKWDIIGKFPYIFGIFHAYSRDTVIRGYYKLTEERLAIASKDDSCIGCVMWPETVHTDTFMTEYFAGNASEPLALDVYQRIDKFCQDRYGENSAQMQKLWHTFFPIVNLMSWSMDASGQNPVEMQFLPLNIPKYMEDDSLIYASDFDEEKAFSLIPEAIKTLEYTANILKKDNLSEFIKRDVTDIIKTVTGRYIHLSLLMFMRYFKLWRDGKFEDTLKLKNLMSRAKELMNILCEILKTHDDYIVLNTMNGLSKNRSINPYFEIALKKNMSCDYHRSYVFESVKMLYIPELDAVCEWFEKNIEENNRPKLLHNDELFAMGNEIRDKYFSTSFESLQSGESGELSKLCELIIGILKDFESV